MGLSVWRETSKKLTVYRVCYTPIETLFRFAAVDRLTLFLNMHQILNLVITVKTQLWDTSIEGTLLGPQFPAQNPRIIYEIILLY